MRVAVVSDVHGNLFALEAVVADVARRAPDLVLQGGDLAAAGSRPAEVIDRIRELGWPGVVGNTDEMLWRPELLDVEEERAPGIASWLRILFETLGPWARERIGDERLAWLRGLPADHRVEDLLLTHAQPEDLWRAPMPTAPDAQLMAAYGGRDADLAVYGHIHRPFVRRLPALTVANAGSAGLPYDGDPRPSYLLIDDGVPTVMRVAYDVERATRDLAAVGFPLAGWLPDVQRRALFQRP